MMRLYDNAFSPFARKVRLVLDLKKIEHQIVDGLALTRRAELAKANPRLEVPALDHDGLVVVGSSDIVAYLERVQPEPAIYPKDHAAWVKARAWERAADTAIDPLLVDLSYWTWANRQDTRPEAWVAAGRRDMARVYDALERDLAGGDFLCGGLSIADVALFPHLSSTRALGVGYEAAQHPRVDAWVRRLRALPEFAADLARAREFVSKFRESRDHERTKIFWRGDRVEWLLANGFHQWLFQEIAQDRVLWPGFGLPGQ